MYRYSNGQTIPWLEIEKRYAALFTNRKGNVAKPLRLASGACIIQAEYGYSDEETAGPLCGEKRGIRWSLARSWTSVSLTDGRGWSAVLLMPTMRREICGKWQSGSERDRGITPGGSWRTKSTETGRISAIARSMGSVFPARLWGGLRRVKPGTRLRTIGMSASAWKWSADSVWRSVNVAWGWSPQSCGRLRPM